MSERMEQRMAV